VAIGTASIFGLSLGITRIVSISSILAAVGASALMIALKEPLAYQGFAIAGSLYVIWRHRANIQRLLAGTEPRVGQKLVVEATEGAVVSENPH
jgi:glycerol-3-phosphate acyltransferase PlsY